MSLLWHHEVALVAVASYLLCVNCSDREGENPAGHVSVDTLEIRRQLRVGKCW